MTASARDPAPARAAGCTPTSPGMPSAAQGVRPERTPAADHFLVRYAVALDEQDPEERVRRFHWRRTLDAEVDELAKRQEDYAILDAAEAGVPLERLGQILGGIGVRAVEVRLTRARRNLAATVAVVEPAT